MTRDELMTIGKRHGVKITHLTKTSDLIGLAFQLGRMEENTACQTVLKECGHGIASLEIQRNRGAPMNPPRHYLDSLRIGDTIAVSNGQKAGNVTITAIIHGQDKMLVTTGVEPHRRMAFWRSNGDGVDPRQWKIIIGTEAWK